MKSTAKRLIQGLSAAAAPFIWRHRGGARLLVLMYHRVLPVDHPDRENEQQGMFVSPDTLAMHLGLLRKYFTLMGLSEWLVASREGRSLPRNTCAVTFDDGWLDNYEYAYPLLSRAQVPATIFLVADAVGTNYAFWPNRLARLLRAAENHFSDGNLAPGVVRVIERKRREAGLSTGEPFTAIIIDQIIAACKHEFSDAEMQAALGSSMEADGARDLFNWEEAEAMLKSGLISFGSHTRRHTRLIAGIKGQLLQDEIEGSKRIIQERLGAAPATFCYPNGDYCAEAVELVQRSYVGAVTTNRGWNNHSTSQHLLQRVGMHEDVSNTPSAFLARLAGVG